MTVTLPDHPSRVAAEMAGVSYDAFLDALQERGISRYSLEMLREDIETLNHLWPDSTLPVPAS